MAFYTVLLANGGYDIAALKATTTPTTGTNWSEQNGSVRVETGGGKVVSMWAVEDSSDLHIATQQEDGRVRYHVFDPGTDAWTTKNQVVANPGDTNFDAVPTDHAVSLALRSDGDVVLVAAYNDGSNETLRLFIKTTSWINQAEATAGTASTDYTGVSVVGPDSSDRISWAYLDTTNDDVDLQSVDSGTTLGTVTEVDAAVDTATFVLASGVIDSANKIYIPYIDASDKISVGNWTSGATPTVSVDTDVSDNTVKGHSASALPFAVACLAVKGTDVHLLYADDTTQDIFHDDDVDGGGATDVERNDVVTANRLSCNYLSSSDVLAWLYLDSTTTVYDEFSLAAAPTGLLVGSLALLGVGI